MASTPDPWATFSASHTNRAPIWVTREARLGSPANPCSAAACCAIKHAWRRAAAVSASSHLNSGSPWAWRARFTATNNCRSATLALVCACATTRIETPITAIAVARIMIRMWPPCRILTRSFPFPLASKPSAPHQRNHRSAPTAHFAGSFFSSGGAGGLANFASSTGTFCFTSLS